MHGIRFFVLLAVTCALPGCFSASGPRFADIEVGPPDQAVVYFYRQKRFQASGATAMVTEDGKHLFRIKNGEFVRHLVEPGVHQFSTDTMHIDEGTELSVERGEVYFVEILIRTGAWVGRWVAVSRPEEEALPVMMRCCRARE